MIQSLLDTDLYQLSQQQAILEAYPNVNVEYKFTDRGSSSLYNEDFLKKFKEYLNHLNSDNMRLSDEEAHWMHNNLPWVKPWYLSYLQKYRFNLDQLHFDLDLKRRRFSLRIAGPWHETIMWEVPLLALISETYFDEVDKGWDSKDQSTRIKSKSTLLNNNHVRHVEFGTRRRRNYETQELVCKTLALKDDIDNHFVGTSNVHIARKLGLKPIGTMSHQWIMAHSSLVSLQKANYFALHNWNRIFGGRLGVALTDTYGMSAFEKDFSYNLARAYDGLRQDSGVPCTWAARTTRLLESLNIDPTTKGYYYSDGLTTELAIKVKDQHKEITKGDNMTACIGTHFTNDFLRLDGTPSPALQIVIKLSKVNGQHVVKLSDTPAKATGDKDALRIAKHFFMDEPLDYPKETEPTVPGVIKQKAYSNGQVSQLITTENGKEVIRRYKNGVLHSDIVDGNLLPAILSGSRMEFYSFGALHREGGPAYMTDRGDKFYYKHGQLHREDGPAIITIDGRKEYWEYGKRIKDEYPQTGPSVPKLVPPPLVS